MDARPAVLNAGFASLPPPWSIDEYNDACFIARDANGQALAYVYFEEETGRRMGDAPAHAPLASQGGRVVSVRCVTPPRMYLSCRVQQPPPRSP